MNAIDAGRFWAYSLSLYQKEKVAEHCLHLQDECGCNVNVFLFCCWLTSLQMSFSVTKLRAVLVGINQQDNQLKIFRIQRHAAKLTHPETYQHLKQQELLMEQVQQGLIVQLYNSDHSNTEQSNTEQSNQLGSHNPITSFVAYYKLSKLQTDEWVTPLLHLI